MYRKLKSCVKTSEGITEFFNCLKGTRQGCILSPFLFTLYIKELIEMLQNYDCKGTYVNENATNVMILLYADDKKTRRLVLSGSNSEATFRFLIDLGKSFSE